MTFLKFSLDVNLPIKSAENFIAFFSFRRVSERVGLPVWISRIITRGNEIFMWQRQSRRHLEYWIRAEKRKGSAPCLSYCDLKDNLGGVALATLLLSFSRLGCAIFWVRKGQVKIFRPQVGAPWPLAPEEIDAANRTSVRLWNAVSQLTQLQG